MKQLLIFLTLISTLCYCKSDAQTVGDFRPMPATQKAKLVTDSLKAMLTLTDNQYTQVYSNILDGINKAMPIARSDDSRLSKGSQIKAIFAEKEKTIKLILTAEQAALYDSKKDNLKAYYRKKFMESKMSFTAPE